MNQPFSPLEFIAAFAVGLEGPASSDPALPRASAAWAEVLPEIMVSPCLCCDLRGGLDVWQTAFHNTQCLQCPTDISLVTALLMAAITHCCKCLSTVQCRAGMPPAHLALWVPWVPGERLQMWGEQHVLAPPLLTWHLGQEEAPPAGPCCVLAGTLCWEQRGEGPDPARGICCPL